MLEAMVKPEGGRELCWGVRLGVGVHGELSRLSQAVQAGREWKE